jgi:hypothetical protein
VKRVPVLLALCSCAGLAENYIRIQADGRLYTLDTDSAAVRRELRIVSPAKAAAKLPAWLSPTPGAAPAEARYDPANGLASATFIGLTDVERLAAWYTQTLSVRHYRVSSLAAGGGGQQVTGSSDAVIINLMILPDARHGGVTVRASYMPRQMTARLRFQALWYDETSGILRLRETSTGDEYDMDKRAMLTCNLNRPGAVESTGAGVPGWLPVYPGAISYPKGKITLLMTPTAQFLTRDSVRQVFEYYLEAIRSAGARITESGTARSGKPASESAHIVAFKDDDKVEIQIGEVMWLFQGIGTKIPDEKIGIAIRYTVPKQ